MGLSRALALRALLLHSLAQAAPAPSLSASPVQLVTLLGRPVFLKRDDLLRMPFASSASLVNGNKTRKFKYLSALDPFPSLLLSFGGVQSNSMAALAEIAHHHSARLCYFTPTVHASLRAEPIGNYRRALELGMHVVEGSELYVRAVEAFATRDTQTALHLADIRHVAVEDACLVPQGGATVEAAAGLADLAEELAAFVALTAPSEPWTVVMESGTGASALFLHRRLRALAADHIQVLAVPCVGDAAYLLSQMRTIDGGEVGLSYPCILEGATKRAFGKPYPALLALWRRLEEESNVEFDLLYAPRAFEQLAESFEREPNRWAGRRLLYVHCGGVSGNESQLRRYARAGMTAT